MIGRLCSTFYVLYLVNATLPNIILIRNVLSACWIPFKAKMTSTIILDGNQQDKSSLPFLLSTFKNLKISKLKVRLRLSTANTKKRNLGHFTMTSYCWCTIAHVSSYCKMHYTSSSLWFSLQVKQSKSIQSIFCCVSCGILSCYSFCISSAWQTQREEVTSYFKYYQHNQNLKHWNNTPLKPVMSLDPECARNKHQIL